MLYFCFKGFILGLITNLDKYCEDVGQTNTMAIERILKQFLDDYDEKTQKIETK